MAEEAPAALAAALASFFTDSPGKVTVTDSPQWTSGSTSRPLVIAGPQPVRWAGRGNTSWRHDDRAAAGVGMPGSDEHVVEAATVPGLTDDGVDLLGRVRIVDGPGVPSSSELEWATAQASCIVDAAASAGTGCPRRI